MSKMISPLTRLKLLQFQPIYVNYGISKRMKLGTIMRRARKMLQLMDGKCRSDVESLRSESEVLLSDPLLSNSSMVERVRL